MKRSYVVLASSLLAVVLAAPAQAHEAGQWILRGGIGTVMPKDDNLGLPEIDLEGLVINAEVQVDDGTSLTLSATYMFTENWAIDILAAWPFSHDVDLDATISDGKTTETGSVPFGEVEHLPPTVSLQYHFAPDAEFQPYVGLGLNYTTFLDEDLDSEVSDVITDFSLDGSFGIATQIGADWVLNETWLVNFDVRWINIESDLDATIAFPSGPVSGEVGTVEIDPWVASINVGYMF